MTRESLNKAVGLRLGYGVAKVRSGYQLRHYGRPMAMTVWATEYGAWSDLPDFCGRMRDVVLEAVESYGYDIIQYSEIQNGVRTYQAFIRGNDEQHEEYLGSGESTDGPGFALCLAFLELPHAVAPAKQD